MSFGYELVLDLCECDIGTFNRESIDGYFKKLCETIDMVQCERYWWDYEGVPEEERPTETHLLGTSAVQFIMTSNIIIHTLDLTGLAFINIFSCKSFDSIEATRITKEWFKAKVK